MSDYEQAVFIADGWGKGSGEGGAPVKYLPKGSL